jgi:hypothetical protein
VPIDLVRLSRLNGLDGSRMAVQKAVQNHAGRCPWSGGGAFGPRSRRCHGTVLARRLAWQPDGL